MSQWMWSMNETSDPSSDWTNTILLQCKPEFFLSARLLCYRNTTCLVEPSEPITDITRWCKSQVYFASNSRELGGKLLKLMVLRYVSSMGLMQEPVLLYEKNLFKTNLRQSVAFISFLVQDLDLVKVLKFADDTAIICIIWDSEKSEYREVEWLTLWGSQNNMQLNKTVEMTMDFRRRPLTARADWGWTVRDAEKIMSAPLPTLQDLYTSRIRKQAGNITTDTSHPGLCPSTLMSNTLKQGVVLDCTCPLYLRYTRNYILFTVEGIFYRPRATNGRKQIPYMCCMWQKQIDCLSLQRETKGFLFPTYSLYYCIEPWNWNKSVSVIK